jgi:hypothetical protein
MLSVHRSPGTPTCPPEGSAIFLPMTLSAIVADPDPDPDTGLGALADRAWAAERAAQATWQALLGNCAGARRNGFSAELSRLSASTGEYAGLSWWTGAGSSHRDRVASFELWVTEALAELDGAAFAEACAGYDCALARALVTARGQVSRRHG